MSAETVEGLEQIIGKLETKHAELIKRNTELTTVRASVAYIRLYLRTTPNRAPPWIGLIVVGEVPHRGDCRRAVGTGQPERRGDRRTGVVKLPRAVGRRGEILGLAGRARRVGSDKGRANMG